MLQTSTAIPMSSRVQTIPLAYVHLETAPALAIGWGQTSHPGSAADDLQFISLPIIKNSECADYWGSPRINDGSICTFLRVGQGEKN